MNTNGSAILAGVKVLDITRIIAGPWCTQSLAEMGATVYKIERPGVGDDMRHLPHAIEGAPAADSSAFVSVNRGKRSITVDFARPEGQQILRDLAAKCDVFIENYKGGNLARYGLDYEGVKRINPGVIYCSITGYGQDGPRAAQPGYDPIFQAVSGIMSTCGVPEGEPGAGPIRTAIAFIDVMTGMTATTAILAALYHRKNGGGGQFLDIALLDVALAAAAVPYGQGYLSTGKSPKPLGNRSALFVPSGCFSCANGGYILIQAGNESQWNRLCQVLNRPDWVTDPRFANNDARVSNSAEIHRQIEQMTSGRESHELAAALSEAGVPCGPVNTFAEAFDDPQVKHRGIRMEMRHPVYGVVPFVRNPMRFSATPVRYHPSPALGADTAVVLQSELGLSEAALEGLRAERLI